MNIWASSHILMGHVGVYFCEGPIQISCSFFCGVVCILLLVLSNFFLLWIQTLHWLYVDMDIMNLQGSLEGPQKSRSFGVGNDLVGGQESEELCHSLGRKSIYWHLNQLKLWNFPLTHLRPAKLTHSIGVSCIVLENFPFHLNIISYWHKVIHNIILWSS